MICRLLAIAMLHFLEQHVLLPKQVLLFALRGALPGDVLDAEQDGRIGTSLIEHLPCVQAHRAVSDAGKLMLDLIVLHHTLLGYDFFQEQPKLWNVPLSVAQLVKTPALGVLRADLEDRIERAAGGYHAQVLVEHQNRLADGIDNGLGERTRIFDVGELFSEPVQFHRDLHAPTAPPIRTIDPGHLQGRSRRPVHPESRTQVLRGEIRGAPNRR